MLAEGHSPVAIAKALNAEALPGPEGRAWRDTIIRGDAARGMASGRNELYVGRLVWNRMPSPAPTMPAGWNACATWSTASTSAQTWSAISRSSF